MNLSFDNHDHFHSVSKFLNTLRIFDLRHLHNIQKAAYHLIKQRKLILEHDTKIFQ